MPRSSTDPCGKRAMKRASLDWASNSACRLSGDVGVSAETTSASVFCPAASETF